MRKTDLWTNKICKKIKNKKDRSKKMPNYM